MSESPMAERSQSTSLPPSPTSPQSLFDINLDYDLLPEPTPEHSVPRESPLPHLEGSILSSDSSIFGTFDETDDEGISVPHSPDSAPTTSRGSQRLPVVDLTDSPPQQRSQPTGGIRQSTHPPRQHITYPTESLEQGTVDMTNFRSRQRQTRRASTSENAPEASSSQLQHSQTQHTAALSRQSGDEPPVKRRKIGSSSPERERPGPNLHGHSSQPQVAPEDVEIEEVDLTDVNDPKSLAQALSKQREDAVKAALQSAKTDDDEGRTVLTSYKCPICMDVLEDATSTVCGHLFCHKCIMDTLRFSEMQRSEESVGKVKGTCPVCRKPMVRSDKQDRTRTLIPLALKLQTSTRPVGKGKGKEVERGPLKRENTTISL